MAEEPAIGEPVNVVGLDMDDRPQEPEMGHAKERPRLDAPTDYEDDFYQWAYKQAELLRQKRFSEVDVSNLVDEIEDMAKTRGAALSRATGLSSLTC